VTCCQKLKTVRSACFVPIAMNPSWAYVVATGSSANAYIGHLNIHDIQQCNTYVIYRCSAEDGSMPSAQHI